MSTAAAFVHWTTVILSLVFALYLGMLLWYTIVFDLVQWCVGAPTRRDLFRRPWLTSSPRDLWGVVGTCPYRHPVLCSKLNKQQQQQQQQQSLANSKVSTVMLLPRPLRRINRFIAGFGVFLLSAHALLPSALMPNGSLPFILGWCITWLCMALSSQWFFMPYIRGGLVENFAYYAFFGDRRFQSYREGTTNGREVKTLLGAPCGLIDGIVYRCAFTEEQPLACQAIPSRNEPSVLYQYRGRSCL
ncbi:hypothetical protein BDF22DRAFT_747014 [Syncephalis plumigaleata]|nr:hypothetical protein BDF22DRAFT_747014 [Syncephalis plumigaleata]